MRGYREPLARNDKGAAEGILAWLSGQPNVAAAAKRSAGVKGDIDHFGALSFLQGVLIVLRDSWHPGLLLVLDEVETIQRVRGDVRDKSLNALRQLIDEVDSGRFPGKTEAAFLPLASRMLSEGWTGLSVLYICPIKALLNNLDRVIQIDSPTTVSSFLQRMGRTGRRAGALRNCLFLATRDEALVQTAGLIDLWAEGYVEPIVPPPEPYHVLAQQLMALVLQERGIGRHTWLEWVRRVPAFAQMAPERVREVVAWMLQEGILWEEEGTIVRSG